LPNRWKLSGLRHPLTRNSVRLNYPDTYSYDLAGNQITKVQTTSAGTETTTNTYNGDDQLTQSVDSSTGTTTYGYDANGSQVNASNGSSVTTYAYDVRNRLSSVTTGGVTTTYGYDDAGNRVSETTGGTTTYYLIDSQNPTGYAKPIEQWTSTTSNRSTATLSMSYVIGDRVLAQATGSGVVSYLLIDGQDNTRLLTSSTGAVTATFNYDAFGDAVGSWSFATAATTILFQQTMYDVPSGLNIFGDGVREVKPGEDSFIESDPPGYSSNQNPITLNSYLLDGANPISNTDQNGHDFSLAELSIGSLISAIGFSLAIPNTANAPEIGGPTYGDTSGQLVFAIPADIGGTLLGRYVIAPAAKFLIGKLTGAFTSATEALIGNAGGQASVNIAARTSDLIASGTGVNITPMSVIDNAAYSTIGRGGRTFITDLKAVTDIIGPLNGDTVTITTTQAEQLQTALGLTKPLESENVITLVNDVASRAPASPIEGNAEFLGGGQGLPGGAPELTIDGIPTRDAGAGLTRITLKVGN
jgi:YD repeat-containing protein